MTEGFPEVVDVPDHAKVGHDILEGLGLNPVDLGTIQLYAGGVCQGTLAEFMGMEKHAPIRDEIIGVITSAQEQGADPTDAVVRNLGFFVRRDEQGDPIRAAAANNNREPDSVAISAAADKKKLLIPTMNP